MFVQRANHPQVQHRAQAAAVFPFGADVAMNGRASERLLPLPLHEDPIQISFLNVIAIGRAGRISDQSLQEIAPLFHSPAFN